MLLRKEEKETMLEQGQNCWRARGSTSNAEKSERLCPCRMRSRVKRVRRVRKRKR